MNFASKKKAIFKQMDTDQNGFIDGNEWGPLPNIKTEKWDLWGYNKDGKKPHKHTIHFHQNPKKWRGSYDLSGRKWLGMFLQNTSFFVWDVLHGCGAAHLKTLVIPIKANELSNKNFWYPNHAKRGQAVTYQFMKYQFNLSTLTIIYLYIFYTIYIYIIIYIYIKLNYFFFTT